MNYESDVAIVGAGPAGSTAAYVLAKLGLNVIIIDKSSFPREKLCGGLLSSKSVRLLEKIFDETEESLNKKIINFSSNMFQVMFKEKTLAKYYSKNPTYFVERTVYDNFLLDKAISSGATFIQNETVKKVDLDSNALFTSKGNKIISKYIVGADGANSIVRKEFENNGIICKDIWRNSLGITLEISIDKKKLPIEKNIICLYFGYIKNGYAWIFPNMDKSIIGIGGLLKDINNDNINDMFIDFLISLGFDKKTIDSFIKKIRGHPIPFGNYIEKPIYKKTILIGDAAGFVNPITGEGIYYAHKSAEIAANAILKDYINQGKLEEDYINNLNLFLLPELFNSKKSRNLYFKIFNNYYLAKIASFYMFKNTKYY